MYSRSSRRVSHLSDCPVEALTCTITPDSPQRARPGCPTYDRAETTRCFSPSAKPTWWVAGAKADGPSSLSPELKLPKVLQRIGTRHNLGPRRVPFGEAGLLPCQCLSPAVFPPSPSSRPLKYQPGDEPGLRKPFALPTGAFFQPLCAPGPSVSEASSQSWAISPPPSPTSQLGSGGGQFGAPGLRLAKPSVDAGRYA